MRGIYLLLERDASTFETRMHCGGKYEDFNSELKIRFDRCARRWHQLRWYGGIGFDGMTVYGMPEWHARRWQV